jgi:endonuclease/exonuclease/phosphatase family metal-dependent hydrolase
MEHADSLMSDEELVNTKNVLRRIRKAVQLRAKQANELRVDMEACPYPVIVCGDFNDTPFSYFYQTIRGDLKDAFLEKGEGFGYTYFSLPVKFRIDYILHSDHLQTYSFHTKEVKLSDHYPITAWMSLQQED